MGCAARPRSSSGAAAHRGMPVAHQHRAQAGQRPVAHEQGHRHASRHRRHACGTPARRPTLPHSRPKALQDAGRLRRSMPLTRWRYPSRAFKAASFPAPARRVPATVHGSTRGSRNRRPSRLTDGDRACRASRGRRNDGLTFDHGVRIDRLGWFRCDMKAAPNGESPSCLTKRPQLAVANS